MMALGLAGSSSLTELDLSYNAFSQIGARALAEAIAINSTKPLSTITYG